MRLKKEEGHTSDNKTVRVSPTLLVLITIGESQASPNLTLSLALKSCMKCLILSEKGVRYAGVVHSSIHQKYSSIHSSIDESLSLIVILLMTR